MIVTGAPGKTAEGTAGAREIANDPRAEAQRPVVARDAYEQSGRRPSAILALGQCERALGLYDDALIHLREYLETNPETREAQRVARTIEVIEELRAAEPPKPTLPQPTLTPPPPPPQAPPPAPAAACVEPMEVRELPPRTLTIPATELARSPAREIEPSPDAPGILSSPIFWIATGAAVLGGALALGFIAASSGGDPYGGNTGVIARP